MAIRQDDTPVYRETSIVLTANAVYRLNRTVENVAIIELSGSVEMSLNDADFSVVRGGIIYKMPEGKTITSIVFREAAGAGANIVVATGDGTIQDNRASFAGNLPVINAAVPNESLQVDMLAADPGLVALAAAINANLDVEIQAQTASLNANIDAERLTLQTALQAATALRSRLSPLSTFATHINIAATDVVTAAANVNGIVVDLATVVMFDLARIGAYRAGTNPFVGLNVALVGGNSTAFEVRDLFIPAGVALNALFGPDSRGFIWYRVL